MDRANHVTMLNQSHYRQMATTSSVFLPSPTYMENLQDSHNSLLIQEPNSKGFQSHHCQHLPTVQMATEMSWPHLKHTVDLCELLRLAYLHKFLHRRFRTPTHDIRRGAHSICPARSLGRCRPHSHTGLCHCRVFHQGFDTCALTRSGTVGKARSFPNHSCKELRRQPVVKTNKQNHTNDVETCAAGLCSFGNQPTDYFGIKLGGEPISGF